MSCFDDVALVRVAEGDWPAAEMPAAREHLARCARCREALSQVERLVSRLRGDEAPSPPADPFVAATTARAVESARPAAPRARPVWLLAAAAALVLVVPAGALILNRRPPDELQARGAGPAPLARKVELEVLVVRPAPRALEAGPLRVGEALGVRVSNVVSHRPLYFVAFVLDSRGEVHWIFPAFLHPGTDPASPRLPVGRERLLEEVVEPEGLAHGPCRVVTVAAAEERRVRVVEARLAGHDVARPVAGLFPGDVVREWSIGCQP